MIESKIINILLGITDLVALVDQRIKFNHLDQNAILPAVLLTEISRIPYETLNSISQNFKMRLQIDIFAKTGIETINIANLIRLGIDGYQGQGISSSRFVEQFDDFDSEIPNSRKIQEFEIIYFE